MGDYRKLGQPYEFDIPIDNGANPPVGVDPATITVTVYTSAGVQAAQHTYPGTITRIGQGQYRDLITTGAGNNLTAVDTYTIEVRTTGPAGYWTAYLDVLPARPDVVTLADAKAALDKSDKRRANDAELLAVVDAVNDWLELKCGAVVPRAVTEAAVVDVRSGSVRLPTRPVLALLSATYAGVAVDVSGWSVSRYGRLSGVIGYYPAPASGPGLVVTHRAGMSPIPRTLPLAGKMLIQHLWQWQRTQSPAPGGFSGDTISIGGIGYGIPNAVADYVEPYALDVFGGVA